MLSCHVNGYGEGSQAAVRMGDTWYGWWTKHGWSKQPQKPLKLTFRNGQEFLLPLHDDGLVRFNLIVDDSPTESKP